MHVYLLHGLFKEALVIEGGVRQLRESVRSCQVFLHFIKAPPTGQSIKFSKVFFFLPFTGLDKEDQLGVIIYLSQ